MKPWDRAWGTDVEFEGCLYSFALGATRTGDLVRSLELAPTGSGRLISRAGRERSPHRPLQRRVAGERSEASPSVVARAEGRALPERTRVRSRSDLPERSCADPIPHARPARPGLPDPRDPGEPKAVRNAGEPSHDHWAPGGRGAPASKREERPLRAGRGRSPHAFLVRRPLDGGSGPRDGDRGREPGLSSRARDPMGQGVLSGQDWGHVLGKFRRGGHRAVRWRGGRRRPSSGPRENAARRGSGPTTGAEKRFGAPEDSVFVFTKELGASTYTRSHLP